MLRQLLVSPVLAHLGMQEILINGRQFSFQHLVQDRDDFGITFHSSPRSSSYARGQPALKHLRAQWATEKYSTRIWQSEERRDRLDGLVGSCTAGAGCRCSGLTIRALRSGSRLRGVGAAIEYTVVQTVQRQFQAIRHAQLVIHLSQVVFYHLLGGSDA